MEETRSYLEILRQTAGPGSIHPRIRSWDAGHFIAKVKVKSEFVDDSFPQDEDNQRKMVSSVKSSSHLFYTEVSFNQNMTQTSCKEDNKYSRGVKTKNNCITTFKKSERKEKLHKCSVCKKAFCSLTY